MDREYIVVETDRVGKVSEVAVCSDLAIARHYSDRYAAKAPTTSTVRIFASDAIETRAGEATK